MRNKKVLFTVQAAAIAAIYVVLTVLFAPIGFGSVQVRFSEALTVLPYFTPAAIQGFLWAVSSEIFLVEPSRLISSAEVLLHWPLQAVLTCFAEKNIWCLCRQSFSTP